ncbi:MAG: glycosyltransferase family 2 protein [Paracoccaceae bacterium]
MKLYISVVSHGHGNTISELDSLGPLSDHFTVVIKNNISDKALLDYCLKYPKITLIDGTYGLGFGGNNNFIYKYCCQSLYIEPQDYFLVLNPDVYFSVNQCRSFIDAITIDKMDFVTINLFKNFENTVFDNSIRNFPSLSILVRKFVGIETAYNIDKQLVKSPVSVDWAAGSFLCFRSALYARLDGFDERYFMYYEDVDICYRAKLNGFDLIYLPFIRAVHLGAFNNRKLLSQHHYWYVKSVIRFLVMSYSGMK